MFKFTKKRLANLILISLAALSITAAIFYSTDSSILSTSVSHDSNCQWHHYNEIAPTYTKHGVKDYWICCQHNDVQFVKPEVGHISESTHQSGFVDTINESDSFNRYLKSYNQTVDFEENYVPKFISGNSNVNSLSLANNEGIDNSTALAINVKSGTYRIDFTKAFLDAMFSDSNVIAIHFDAKASGVFQNFGHGSSSSHSTYELNNDGWGLDTNYKTFSYTRSFYNSYTDGDSFLYGSANDGAIIYLDNIRASTKLLNNYGFECGRMVLPTTSGYEHKMSLRISTAYNEYFVAQGDPITSYGFDYSNKTEGNRSARFTKDNGYVALFMPYIYSTLTDNSLVYFDLYSSVDVNASLNAQNVLDGNNVATYGAISKEKWTTFTVTKEQMNGNGRFLIIQGSSAGDYYIDNIRVETFTTDSTNKVTNLGNIVIDSVATGEGQLFTLDHPINNLRNIYLDGTKISASDIVGDVKSNSFKIANSAFTDGTHKVTLSYVSDSTLYTEDFYLETKVSQTSQATINLSAAYGTNDYYTLSGYTGIYRITSGDNEIPFEISDSNYLIPVGSLIQLLPETSGQKVSGEISLHLYSLSNIYLQKFNISLSDGGNTKAIPNYNGKGIPTHAYSSTQSQTTTDNYQEHFSIDRVVEYDNTGLTLMYEQSIAYSSGATSLPATYKLLFKNANAIGQKVMIVDYAFQLIAKNITSIIGTTMTFMGKSWTFNTSTDIKNFCKERMSTYINEPALGGICFIDEPTYAMLDGSLKDFVPAFKETLKELGHEDMYFSINLLPMNAGSERLIGTKTTEDPVNHFKTYVEKYFEISNNDYLQFDIYPLATNEKGGNFADKDGGIPTGISRYGYQNVLLAAELAKAHNAEFHIVTQSFAYNGVGDRALNQADIAFLNNTILGMGCKHVSYFVYCNRSATGSETWYDDGAFLTKDGVRNPMYYYMTSMCHQIKNFGTTISAFNYESWAKFVSKGTTSQKSKSRYYSEGQSLMESYSYSSYYSTIKSIEISSGTDWALFTALKNASTGNVMYMMQNAYNKFGTSDMFQILKVTFNQKYTYAFVYENGSARVVNLSKDDIGTIIKRSISLKLSAGHAAYVIPF